MLSITPATSAAGENGNGGLIWYLPWIIRMSKKFSAADLIAITASPGPATGSGTSASTRSSGWQYCEQRMAFMDTPEFRTHKARNAKSFLPDLTPGYNPFRMHLSACRSNLPSLRATGSRACAPDDKLREAIHSSFLRRDGLLRRFAPRNDGDNKGVKQCLKKACWRENGFWSPA